MTDTKAESYHYNDSQMGHMHAHFLAPIVQRLRELKPARVLDLGCGNGSLCRAIKDQGFDVCGFDPSKEGIELASSANPDIRFLNIGVYDQPPEEWLGAFDLVVSTEVVEHLYNPRALPAFAKKVLKPGGHALITTPYHGYLKNLALSVLDKWDAHHTVFWEHGHIKFFSRHTLKKLFEDDGYQTCSFKGLGRLPWLWMTMLMEFKLAER